MLFAGKALRAAVAAGLVCVAFGARALDVDFTGERASADARYVAQWIADTGDNHGQPFAIVDKKDAKLFVFGAAGRLVGASSALLGAARGDSSAPGVGHMEPASIPLADRTTPAGRFASEPGRNLNGEDIVWVEYDTAVAIHRLRPSPPKERRAQRLASPNADEHRISLGCVVVPVAFYETVVARTLGVQQGVVYVLPETRPVRELFGAQRRDD
jgi:hypothetical protein